MDSQTSSAAEEMRAAEGLPQADATDLVDSARLEDLNERTRRNVDLWAACVAGAIPRASYAKAIETVASRSGRCAATITSSPAFARSRRAAPTTSRASPS